MSPLAFALVFMAGAALVGLWLATRYQRRAPGSVWSVAAHVLIANLATSAAFSLLVPAIGRVGTTTALMVVAFPPLVYFFVTCAWLLLLVQRLATSSSR